MMKTFILVVVLLIGSAVTFAQNCAGRRDGENKAFNGDFEQTYGTCTAHVGEATDTKGALGWNGVPGTIDGRTFYLNTCSSSGTYHPLDNVYGTQAPLNGNGYYAIVAGQKEGVSTIEETYEGYIAHELATPLLKGITYYIEFNVSLADKSTVGVKSLGMYLTNNLTDLTPVSAPNYHNLTPQIPNTFPASTAYLNYSGWTTICGQYTPTTDGVKYLVIGRFRNELYEYSGTPGYNGGTLNRPVYYIDGVYIQEYACCPENKYFQNTSSLPLKTAVNNELVAGYNVSAQPPGNVNITSGQDVTFQSGKQIILKPGFHAQSGSTLTTILEPCERGVDDNQLAVDIVVDDTTPGQYTLTASATNGSGGYTYRWSTGATTASIIVTDAPATHTVVATDNVPDASTPAPCNVRAGIGEFVIECISCRQLSAQQPEITSASNEEQGGYVVYPNPSNGLFTVNLHKEKLTYGVYSLTGVEMIRGVNTAGLEEVLVDMRTAAKGKYVVRIVDASRKSISRLILIE